MGKFFPVPIEELKADFAGGRGPEDICAETIHALLRRGMRNIYLSNLPTTDVEGRMARLEARLEDSPHHRRIIDFLGVVEFRPARVARRVVVADDFLVLPDAAYDVPVHDLHVIDVEEQLEAGRSDFIDHPDAMVDVVAEVSGMPLHGMGVVA